VYGVGPILSKRIVRYRKRLQGFSMEKQLREVWGLKSEVLERILRKFEIKNAPRIEKTNINTATFKEVLSIMYLDYPQTLAVFRYKDARGKIETLEELKKIEGFPVEKYDRIVLYLQAQ
jgi:DNA uptake protein ComE-like DNA-binding protein